MRKFLLPIISIVNLILAGIAFGLGGNTAAYSPVGTDRAIGNYYQLVWNQPTVMSMLAFFFFVFAVFFTLVYFIPFKHRKFANVLVGGLFIAAGLLTLTVPNIYAQSNFAYTRSGSLIAMTVLMCVAGGLSLLSSLIEFADKE